MMYGWSPYSIFDLAVQATVVPVINQLRQIGSAEDVASMLQYVAALDNLSRQQVNAALSATELTYAEKAKITQMNVGAATLQSYTAQQLVEKHILDAETLSKIEGLKAEEQLTIAKINAIITSGELSGAEKARVVTLLEQLGATNALTAGTLGLNTSLKATLVLMLQNPMTWIMIAVAAMPLLIKAFKGLNDILNGTHESLDAIKEDIKSMEREADDLQKRIDTNLDRMKELEKVDLPSIAEEEELRRLERENDLLELQLETQKKLLAARNQDRRRKAGEDIDAFMSESTYSGDPMWDTGYQQATGLERLTAATRDYNEASKKFEELTKRAKAEAEKGNIRGAAIIEADAKKYENAMTAYLEIVNVEMDTLSSLREEIADSIDDKDITRLKAIDTLIDSINLSTNKESAERRIFDRFFPKEEDIKNADKVKEFAEYMAGFGIDVDTSEESLRRMFQTASDVADSVREISDAVSDITVSQLDEAKDAMDGLGSAFAEMVADGKLSFDTLADLNEQFKDVKGIDDYISRLAALREDAAGTTEVLNEMAMAYIEQTYGTEALAEADENIVSGWLKEIGVANNTKAAVDLIAIAKEKLALKTAVADNKLQPFLSSLQNETAYSEAAKKELYKLALAEVEVNNTNMNLESQIEAIGQIAAAAGVACGSLTAMQKLMADPEGKIYGVDWDTDEIITRETLLRQYMKIAAADVKKQIDSSVFEWDKNFGKNSGSGSGSGSSKATERYLAELDRFRVERERLNDAQERATKLESEYEHATNLAEQIRLNGEMAKTYIEEQNALNGLTEARRQAIQEGVDTLKSKYNFNIEYDAKDNRLDIKNMEHLRELATTDLTKWELMDDLSINIVGTYDNATEATNGLIKNVEKYIDLITGWNDENLDASNEEWWSARKKEIERYVENDELIQKAIENGITQSEYRLDRAVGDRDYAAIQRETDQMLDYYRQQQEQAHAMAQFYRLLNYDETSEAITAQKQLWEQAQEGIDTIVKETWDQVVENARNSVDSIQNVYDTLHQAADEYAERGGKLTLDTYKAVLDLGPQYYALLKDENGQFSIKEENIRKVMAAQAEQLAIEESLGYIENLRLALSEHNEKALGDLLEVTEDAGDATWSLVYANLANLKALGMSDEEYQKAIHNIRAIQSLAFSTVRGIGDEVGETGDLLEYVMEMIKQEVDDTIQKIEDQKKSYADLISMEKERLQNAKKEADYQKEMSKNLKSAAELQRKIDSLTLAANSGDRKAQAERDKLLADLSDLNETIADNQAEHTLEINEDTLDKMQTQYELEKDEEIKGLKESIQSKERLVKLALERIKTDYATLKDQLLTYNERIGQNLTEEIEGAWDKAKKAAEDYFGYVNGQSVSDTANKQLRSGASKDSGGSSGSNNTTVSDLGGGVQNHSTLSTSSVSSVASVIAESKKITDQSVNGMSVSDVVRQMKANGAAWHSGSNSEQGTLVSENERLAELLNYAKHLHVIKRGGVWYDNGEELFKKYHTGGEVGKDEIPAILQKGEWVLSKQMVKEAKARLDIIDKLSKAAMKPLTTLKNAFAGAGLTPGSSTNISNITNTDNRPVEIKMGDVIINGANGDTVKQHQKISREQVNEIARLVGLKQ